MPTKDCSGQTDECEQPVTSSLAVSVISVFSSLHPIREKTNYWHQIPIGARAGQNWVAKVLRLGVFE